MEEEIEAIQKNSTWESVDYHQGRVMWGVDGYIQSSIK